MVAKQIKIKGTVSAPKNENSVIIYDDKSILFCPDLTIAMLSWQVFQPVPSNLYN